MCVFCVISARFRSAKLQLICRSFTGFFAFCRLNGLVDQLPIDRKLRPLDWTGRSPCSSVQQSAFSTNGTQPKLKRAFWKRVGECVIRRDHLRIVDDLSHRHIRAKVVQPEFVVRCSVHRSPAEPIGRSGDYRSRPDQQVLSLAPCSA